VGDLADWRVTMMVPEREVNKIEMGDRVRLEVQAFRQSDRRQLEARVTHVAAEPVGSGASGAGPGAGGAPAAAPTGGGVYRVVASLDRDQVEPGELERFRRGYSVSANVVTKSGRIIELVWNYVGEKLNRK
jgi:hypothetical protein